MNAFQANRYHKKHQPFKIGEVDVNIYEKIYLFIGNSHLQYNSEVSLRPIREKRFPKN